MNFKLILILSLFVFSVLCHLKKHEAKHSDDHAKEIVVNFAEEEEQKKYTVELALNEKFDLLVEEITSTGFVWTLLDSEEKHLTLVS